MNADKNSTPAIETTNTDNVRSDNADSEDEPLSNLQMQLRSANDDDIPLSQIRNNLRGNPVSGSTPSTTPTGNRLQVNQSSMALKGNIKETVTFSVPTVITVCTSQGSLNQHYLSNHGNLKCSMCS